MNNLTDALGRLETARFVGSGGGGGGTPKTKIIGRPSSHAHNCTEEVVALNKILAGARRKIRKKSRRTSPTAP